MMPVTRSYDRAVPGAGICSPLGHACSISPQRIFVPMAVLCEPFHRDGHACRLITIRHSSRIRGNSLLPRIATGCSLRSDVVSSLSPTRWGELNRGELARRAPLDVLRMSEVMKVGGTLETELIVSIAHPIRSTVRA